MTTHNFLEVENVEKSYGAVHALRGASLAISQNEIVGIAGDNGAGKSTLLKIIAGAITPTRGRIVCNGVEIDEYTPTRARERKIETVYQDLALCDNLSVAENIFLGREPRHGWPRLRRVRFDEMVRSASQILERLGITLASVREPVSELSGGQRQAVAIARVLAFQPKLVILDEPTAALSINAAQPLLEIIKQLPRQGTAVMLVSHRLQDLISTTERTYVLRHGSVVAECKTSETDEEGLLRLMAGLPSAAARG